MIWIIVGPECPECGHNEGTVLGQLMAHDDDPPERVVGQKVRCRFCNLSYNSWVDPKYDPDYDWDAPHETFGKQGFGV